MVAKGYQQTALVSKQLMFILDDRFDDFMEKMTSCGTTQSVVVMTGGRQPALILSLKY